MMIIFYSLYILSAAVMCLYYKYFTITFAITEGCNLQYVIIQCFANISRLNSTIEKNYSK